MSTATESSHLLRCFVNGSPVELRISEDEELTLLDVLRDDLGITSPKNGCQPQAQCGCCTVLLDDKPVLSCALKPAKVEGKSITTLEGLDEEHRQQIAQSFVQCGGVQCGFCIPGMAMRAVGLCSKKPDLDREEIATGLKPHLCRCTGYAQIVDSIEEYSRVRRGEMPTAVPAADASGKVGTSLPRYTGHDAVLGDRKFIDDMTVPGMLFGALRLADHPKATVVAIDPSAALALPGVHRVVTAADVPGDSYVGLIERDWPTFVSIGEQTRCTGDVIAGVVADDQRLARRAAALVDVKYTVHEPVTDPRAALEPDAPLVHPTRGTNLLSKSSLKRGDVEAGFQQAAHVLEDTYRTQHIEHLFLEPESCLAVPQEHDGDFSLHVYSQGQGVFDDQRQIASGARRRKRPRQVDLVSNGGAFGGKEDMSIQAQTALMAWLLGKPVKMTLTRPRVFASIRNAIPSSCSTRSAATTRGDSLPSRRASSATRALMRRSARRF